MRLDAAALPRLVPDLADRDVYVCGPDGFTDAHRRRPRAPASRRRIHHESFAVLRRSPCADAPIVLAATAAGLAAVLSFHAARADGPDRGRHGHRDATPPTADARRPARRRPTRRRPSASGTATGDAVATQYGTAQVRVTVSGGKITKIEALAAAGQRPASRCRSPRSAEPMLRKSALAKQTAAVDAVSGATFTSASYEASLQSALDKLGFKAADGSVATLQVPSGGGH